VVDTKNGFGPLDPKLYGPPFLKKIKTWFLMFQKIQKDIRCSKLCSVQICNENLVI
jgi:hypothetical protein